MKEYGGYLELEKNYGEEYYSDFVRLNCGRNCLAYLFEMKNIRKIFLPFFLCESVKCICEKYRVDYEEYLINEKFFPIFEKKLDVGEYLYVVNYYGQLEKDDILKLKMKYQRIIVDNVQAFFEEPVRGCDTIYSCRKYFGVPDGAYLYTVEKTYKKYQIDISYERMLFLLGRFEKKASDFYSEYVNNNKLFNDESIKCMSKLTMNLLKGIDYTFVKKRREINYQYLENRLGKRNGLALKLPKGAFAYPFFVENGDVLRKKLQKNKIYIPILWPEVLETQHKDSLEYRLACNILPLPVDQRYTKADMEYICNVIDNCIEDKVKI